MVRLEIEGKNIDFQIDTGFGISTKSVNDLKQYNIAELKDIKSTDLSLKAYNGSISSFLLGI